MQFLLILVLVLIGCGNPKPQSPGSTDGSSQKVSAVDGLVVDDISGLYFEVGQSTPFSGTAAWYYPDGKLMQETHIDGGREHGVERWWYSTGKRMTEVTYKNGFMVDGASWDPSGTPTGRVEKGDGFLTAYHENGNRSMRTSFKDGAPVSRESWNPDGTHISAESL
mgnify:CR=1 FL=1